MSARIRKSIEPSTAKAVRSETGAVGVDGVLTGAGAVLWADTGVS
jgi:hypothetical protein